ncbi:MAG TPA: protein-disulfide reductase DsbD N-terminal domain-containing protein [Pyrinomonadaceae bacterium]|jgi:DsbC/DsbD-like thiol-disulfide interchange protein|nr:protein-disulfide reductase DsbD N-terminal domain-containing protein [Pyrinomonadaceae bacterium]
MHRIIAFILCGMLLLAFAACARKDEKATAGAANTSSNQEQSATGATKTPPADIVRAEAASMEMAAGGAAEAVVLLTIADGYHISANPATLSYQIATQLNVEPSDGITVGQPLYPPSETKKFSFEPQPFAVYEGKAPIKLPLRAEAGAAKGAHTLKAKVRVQACDDQACYPPRTLNTSIPVNVK